MCRAASTVLRSLDRAYVIARAAKAEGIDVSLTLVGGGVEVFAKRQQDGAVLECRKVISRSEFEYSDPHIAEITVSWFVKQLRTRVG